MDATIQIHFIGAKGRMEMQKVPEAGYKIDGLWISGFQRDNIFKNLLLPFKVVFSLIKAENIISKFRPDIMVGVGGYASGPAMYVAHRKGIPVLIQEQNSFPGVTNKLMARRADRFCVAYDGMEKYFPEDKIIKTGNPVRENIANLRSDKAESLRHFGLSSGRKTLLVIGGSLGSKTINESIAAGVKELVDQDIQVIWQTGKFYFDGIKNAVAEHRNIKIYDFIREMNLAYDAADVIISRAGAIAISELCVVKKPVILVPSPNVAEDHQTKNALALKERNAVWMVKDADARQVLVKKAIELLRNEEEQKKLSENIAKLALPDAADKIAKAILQLLK
jgi:UDP-N-acetylglucosamine--N-acetylmuramyl-(pentapeptide) pyrophosphoryl-undecaprenol N-acetylglucosamine transferase